MKAKLIGIIGLDGSGKTTLTASLSNFFKQEGYQTTSMHFWPSLPALPSFSKSASSGGKSAGLSKLPGWKAFGLLMIVRWMQYWALPRLSRKYDVILCDRYLYDLVTYFELRGHPGLAKKLLQSPPVADVVFWLQAEPEELQKRKSFEHPLNVYQDWFKLYQNLNQQLEASNVQLQPLDAHATADAVLAQAQQTLKEKHMIHSTS